MNLVALDWQALSGMAVISIFAGVLSYFSCRATLGLATRSGMIVQPGERQSHQVATPTGGGLGLVFSLIITTVILQSVLSIPVFWWMYMLPGVVLLTIAGWLDDRRHVSSLLRLSIQLIVTLWLVSFTCREGLSGSIVICAGLVVAMIWLMNLYNFMDGSDGMAGFQGVFAGLVMAALFIAGDQVPMAMLSLVTAAACAGFLPLNFPQARIFMGDVASVPLGFIFASLAIYGLYTGTLSLALSILVMAVFIVDASLTLLARVFAGERWYTAHNQHVYQRLIAHGWSHSRVLLLYLALNVLLVLPAIVLAATNTQYANVTAGFTLLLLVGCWYTANRKLGMHAIRRLE